MSCKCCCKKCCKGPLRFRIQSWGASINSSDFYFQLEYKYGRHRFGDARRGWGRTIGYFLYKNVEAALHACKVFAEHEGAPYYTVQIITDERKDYKSND